MRKTKTIISGKVLVSGEHSVVYGEPAIVAAVDRKMEISLEEANKFELVSEIEDKMGLVKFALEKSALYPEKVRITIKSEIPKGMGTSAAVCAGVIKAAYEYQSKKLDKKTWHQLAWECEKKAHSNSSGVDPAAVIYRGLSWYVRGKELEQLKINQPYKLILIDTGSPIETTGNMVSLAATKDKKIFKKIGVVTKSMRVLMEKGGDIKHLINENGILLEELGVVGKKAIAISNKFRSRGFGVKITGAGGIEGGSGSLIVVGGSLKIINDLGYEAFEVTIGGQ